MRNYLGLVCWLVFAALSVHCNNYSLTTKVGANTEKAEDTLPTMGVWNYSFQFWSLHRGRSVHGDFLAPPGSFPYIAMVKSEPKRCTGVIINKDWVISSSFCFTKDRPVMYAGGIGYERGELKMSEGAQMVYADQQVEYTFGVGNRLYLRHDVLLLHAEAPGFELTRFVSPTIVTNQRRFLVKKSFWTCFVLGFGAYGRETLTMTSLMKSCPYYVPEEDTICSERSRWPCQGDAGAPLVCQKMLVGIVQTHQLHPNKQCRERKIEGPARYTFVGYYSDWILENAQEVRFGVWDVGSADPVGLLAWRSVIRLLPGAVVLLVVLR